MEQAGANCSVPESQSDMQQEEQKLNITDLPNGVLHHIFSMLGPRDLCVASAVCKDWLELNRDAFANRVWEGYYSKRWQAPKQSEGQAPRSGWQAHYGRKMRSARAFSNRGIQDVLYNHKAAVTGCALLPSLGLLATGSVDNNVRLWDLKAGLPIACSKQLKGPIRCLAADNSMLVCGGGPDGMVRLWRGSPSNGPKNFDLSIPTRLAGHTGPVSAVALDSRNIYSASWDCTLRIWNRASLCRESLLAFPDWVHCVQSRGCNLLVTAGNVLHVHSAETGQSIFKFGHTALKGNSHWDAERTTAPLQVEGSQDGRTVFLGGIDGAIVSVDLRAPKEGSTVLWNQKNPVKSLKYEDPWLAAATADGSVLLIDVAASMANSTPPGQKRGRIPIEMGARKPRTTRQRLSGPQGPALCVDIQDNYVACGSADPVVRTWFFDHIDKQERRAMTAPRRRQPASQRATRPQYSSDSEQDSEDGTQQSRLTSSGIPLSSSLPSVLGQSFQTTLTPDPSLAPMNPTHLSHSTGFARSQQEDADRQDRGTEAASCSSPLTKEPAEDCGCEGQRCPSEERKGSWAPHQSKLDTLDPSEMSSDSSDWSYDLVWKARDREQEYRISDSPRRSTKPVRNRLQPPKLAPSLNCRSEQRSPSQHGMANWSVCSTGRKVFE